MHSRKAKARKKENRGGGGGGGGSMCIKKSKRRLNAHVDQGANTHEEGGGIRELPVERVVDVGTTVLSEA